MKAIAEATFIAFDLLTECRIPGEKIMSLLGASLALNPITAPDSWLPSGRSASGLDLQIDLAGSANSTDGEPAPPLRRLTLLFAVEGVATDLVVGG